ncbi:MAG: ankyrin repeat domain-containing protein [Candidatus Acidiferrum sp.]
MPVRRLPPGPSLDHLRYQAKDLMKQRAARDLAVAQKIREFHPRFTGATDDKIFTATLTLADAQLTIAREYGFRSWPRLKAHIETPAPEDSFERPHHERIRDPAFRHAVNLIDAGDAAGLARYLKQHPHLTRQHVEFEGGNYFKTPTLLEFIAENPVRSGRMSGDVAQVAKVILDAGVDRDSLDQTLMLVSTGTVARECGMQIPLIQLLCDYGADPRRAIEAATVLNEPQAVDALIERGACITFPVAAALGRVDEVRRLFPLSTKEERHLALALAAQFNRVEIARLLLDSGEDPNRYNPVGGHSHSTPLHQAAAGGYEQIVRLLLERGARADLRDVLWHGTPADWARYTGKTELETLLRFYETGARPNE